MPSSESVPKRRESPRKRGATTKPSRPEAVPLETEDAPRPDPQGARRGALLFSPRNIYLASVVLKLLLVYTYASTDLDVHTNWLAITHSRPFKDWYADHASTSEWTLDYPPFFAWFEFGLAKIASIFPFLRPFLDVENEAYTQCGRHIACLLFQRLSVIASEFVLFAAVVFATIPEPRRNRALAIFLVLFHPGLLIVDHIHFQYNGFLLGLLLISTTLASSGNDVLATVAFSMLLCFKHIYLYVAPAFGCYYLGVLFNSQLRGLRRIRFFVSLAAAATFVLALAFGPVYYYGMTGQMVRRLFPLERGLIHAYWAPNFWALYATAEKVSTFFLGAKSATNGVPVVSMMSGMSEMSDMVSGSTGVSTAAFTGGLVQVTSFQVLPQVTSTTTAVLTLVSMLPAMIRLLRRPIAGQLWPAVVYCSLCSFMFGYHVHEKAILMTLIPMAVSIVSLPMSGGGDGQSRARSRYLFLSLIGTYSLFPLLTGVEEYPVKVGMLVGYGVVARRLLGDEHFSPTPGLEKGLRRPGIIENLERFYATYGIVAVELYATFLHRRVFGDAWPFVPLMLVSRCVLCRSFHVPDQ